MCGIVGFSGFNDHNLLQRMNNLLEHRGPDETGDFIDKKQSVSLAMKRLSVIDLEKGKQPIANESGSLRIICNGEIYNSPQLREELIARGHTFRTKNSDVEVIIHLYEEKGFDLLADLNGMFAFVLYDAKKNILFAARDRFGIKPFYYTSSNGRFAFASELKSLLLLPWVSRDIEFSSLYHFLSLQYIPAPKTIFSSIQKLPAGHFLIYGLSGKSLKIEKYWDLDVVHTEKRTESEWIELLRDKLHESVKRWALSDVPIACSLSGGLDSSLIVGLLAKSGVTNLRTYSLGFGKPEEQGCNELPLARKVAEKWGTNHCEVILEPESVLNDIEKMVWHLDEPYAGGLPSWYIYELIGKETKVCLTGTGGDELFSNYGRFRIYEKPAWFRHLKNFRNAVRYRTISEMSNARMFPKGHFYPCFFSDAVKNKIVCNNHGYPAEIKTERYIEDVWRKSKTDNPRNAVAYVDFKMQLPEEFLLVTDRFSMAHSVEARVPFLDHSLVELVFRIPPETRTGLKEPKYLLKQVAGDLLPSELLCAPKKGFVLPLTVWTRRQLRPLIEKLLAPDYFKHQGFFSPRVYERIVKPHLSGKIDFTQQVWTLFMFQMWYRKYVDGCK
ncbi:asparagine synthase (glutamine-hydrolyzing) [Candidatus Omnitrophota bacterium]